MNSCFDDILLDKISADGEVTTCVGVGSSPKFQFVFTFSSVDNALYEYSKQYYNAAKLIADMIVEQSRRQEVTDQCPIGMLYFLRHSVELMLKAIIFKQTKSRASQLFSDCKHELTKLKNNINFQTLDKAELAKMTSYFSEIDTIDPAGDLFRYPFNEDFLRTYHNRFFDIYDMFGLYSLYFKDLNYEYTGKPYEILDLETIKQMNDIREKRGNLFIIEATHGMGYFMIWEPNYDYPSYNQIEGYGKIGKYLYNHMLNDQNAMDICVPLMFTYRHLVEISMKNFIYHILDHFRDKIESLAQKNGDSNFKSFRSYMRCHEIHKKLLDNVEASLRYLATEFNWPQERINTYRLQIEEIKMCDKNSEKFGYPIDKSCSFFEYPTIYVDSFCKLCEQCAEIPDNCSYAFEDMKDWYYDMIADCYGNDGGSDWC